MKGFKRAAVSVLVAGLGLGNNAQAEPLYNIIDLGTLGGSFSFANAINASGQVTGYSAVANDTSYHAFVTNSSGIMSDLGTLGGGDSVGRGINSSGQVTGWFNTDGRFSYAAQRAFVTNSYGEMSDLGTLGGDSSIGHSINDSGQVTGSSNLGYQIGLSNNATHAFITNSSGVMSDLNNYISVGGVMGSGTGINVSGQVTGTFNKVSSSIPHVFSTSSLNNLTTSKLGGGDGSYGAAINASGQVTGSANTDSGAMHAFITNSSTGVMSDLGTLTGGNSSYGQAINASGQVSGYSETSNPYSSGLNGYHAFVTDKGVMKDLNNLLVGDIGDWLLQYSNGINDAGQITGTGVHNGEMRAFVLTPVAAVPVPAAFWLFTTGLGLLSFANRRKAQGNML